MTCLVHNWGPITIGSPSNLNLCLAFAVVLLYYDSQMMSSRRDFIKFSLGGLSAGVLWGSPAANQTETISPGRRKNVLFVIVEDLKAIMGCYGNPLVRTPNIDRLARRGLVFDRAYCQFPVCNPSRTSFLTGLRPDKTRILNNIDPWSSTVPERKTLPRLFRDSGYHTVGLGKVFHGGEKHDDPRAWDQRYDFRATETGRKGRGRNMTGGEVKWCRWLAAEGDDSDQPDGLLADKAIAILRQPGSKPFFMALGFHKPHDPFNAPKKYFDMYPLEKLMPPVVPESRPPDSKHTIGSAWKDSFDKFTLQDKREFLRSYYACITFMDAQLGRVLDELDKQDLWRNTAVVFIGDHGYNLGEHNWWNKNVLFEDSARVPMIAVVEGETKRGTRCSRFVELVDLYPTFADICGLTAPAGLDGLSFRPLLSTPDIRWKKTAFTQVQRGQTTGKSVRTKRWRYYGMEAGRESAWSGIVRPYRRSGRIPESGGNRRLRRCVQRAVSAAQK